MAWRRANEGLSLTRKGKKEGSGGRVANFFVAISHKKGVVLCQQYFDRLNGDMFYDFVKEHFTLAFSKSTNSRNMLFLQDGDPSQNSARAHAAFDEIGCKVFSIPARSPDLNPIENMFNVVLCKLHEDALTKEIKRENFEEFFARVKHTLGTFPQECIDRTIELLPKRIKLIWKGKGLRTKY